MSRSVRGNSLWDYTYLTYRLRLIARPLHSDPLVWIFTIFRVSCIALLLQLSLRWIIAPADKRVNMNLTTYRCEQ